MDENTDTVATTPKTKTYAWRKARERTGRTGTSVYLPIDAVEMADRAVETVSAMRPEGGRVSRSEAVREALALFFRVHVSKGTE